MSPSGDAWRIRPFRSGDETGVCQLLERGFGRSFDVATWRWKLKQRPSPVENVWLAVDHEDQPIFHYGGIPRTLSRAGIECDAMVAVDSTTDPKARRRGILTAGVSTAHRAWTAAGVACVLGLPNEQWGSRASALDWQPLFPLTWLIRPLRPERLLARRLGLSILDRMRCIGHLWRSLPERRPDPSLEIRDVSQAPEGVSDLATACVAEGLLLLLRDREWLDWRYPRDRYQMLAAFKDDRLVGYSVYRLDRDSDFGFIAELLTRPSDDDAQRALTHAAIHRLSNLGAAAVATLAVPESEPYRAFRRTRFFSRRKSFPVHCVPLTLPVDPLRDCRRWWLQGGDFDVI